MARRAVTLRDQGLDFANAGDVFEGRTVIVQDERFDHAPSNPLRRPLPTQSPEGKFMTPFHDTTLSHLPPLV